MFFVTGGTGFIGGYLTRALKESGHEVLCLVRSPEKASLCEKTGLAAVIGDITTKESLKGRLGNCDIVVHLVGIIEENRGITFEKIHVEGTRNLVDEAKLANIRHIFYMSALGASQKAQDRYSKTKAEAEEIVKTSGIPYTIFRPSLVVGSGSGFTKTLKGLIRLGPVVPIPGDGNSKFQPIYVEDLARCFREIFSNPLPVNHSPLPMCELGGPEHLTYNEIVIQFMESLGTSKPLIHLPLSLIKLGLPFSFMFKGIGKLLGKQIPSVTNEQLSLLQTDNICDIKSVEDNFGFRPLTYREALKLFITKTDVPLFISRNYLKNKE